jgi:hypothetical protein
MEQEHVDPDFREIYDEYIRNEKDESEKIYLEIAPELTLPARRINRWWIPAAAAALLLVFAGTWILTSDQNPFRSKSKYTQAEVRKSLEQTIRALSACSKTVREEFSQVEDLTAMTDAIKPAKKVPTENNSKQDSNTTKN